MTHQTHEMPDLGIDVADGLDGLVVGGIGPTSETSDRQRPESSRSR